MRFTLEGVDYHFYLTKHRAHIVSQRPNEYEVDVSKSLTDKRLGELLDYVEIHDPYVDQWLRIGNHFKHSFNRHYTQVYPASVRRRRTP